MVTSDFDLPFTPDTHISFVSGFVLEAGRFNSKIEICCGDMCLNAKSFLGLLYTSAHKQFTIKAEGDDERQALEQLLAYVEKYR
jgi:phosphotransferase system HPr-like phosphotransfer protein